MSEYEETDWDGIDSSEDVELNEAVDRALDKSRPERYFARDHEWMSDIIEMVAEDLRARPTDLWQAAQKIVRGRDGQATRAANKVFRDIARQGTLFDGWGAGDEWERIREDLLSKPISIGGQRIRLGSASPHDLDEWVEWRKREAEKRNGAEAEAWKGAELFAQWAREQGVDRLEDLRKIHVPK